MTTLTLFVDYDNVEARLRSAGPVALAKALVAALPTETVARHDGVHVRLYGGWRSNGVLTTNAQLLIPDIRANSPAYIGVAHDGATLQKRLTVELAERPIGSMAILRETYARERSIRKFRTRRPPFDSCVTATACGLNSFASISHATECSTEGCGVRLGDILIQDEQKMVDTLIVADMAYQALIQRLPDLVVVSSDTDLWPGILLALVGGCRVTQIHPKPGARTQSHLTATLNERLAPSYSQVCV